MGVSTRIKSSMKVGTEVNSAIRAVPEKQNLCLEVVTEITLTMIQNESAV